MDFLVDLWYNLCMVIFNLLFVAILALSIFLDLSPYITFGAMLVIAIFNIINVFTLLRGIHLRRRLNKEFKYANLETMR